MADDRYQRLLGIEPEGDIPSHYELLGIERDEQDEELIESRYREQMRKLQQIRTSKDKGFIEFLKEELRNARLTLSNSDRRKAYDESLRAEIETSFRAYIQPMMALGTVPKGLCDTLVAKGVSDGLGPEHALRVLQESAAAANAILELDGPGSGSGAVAHEEVATSDEALSSGHSAEDEVAYDDLEEPTFTDDLDAPVEPARRGPPGGGTAERVLRPPPGHTGGGEPVRRPPAAVQARLAPPGAPAEVAPGRGAPARRGFYEETAPKAPAAPARQAWARGGRTAAASWGQRAAATPAPGAAATPASSGESAQSRARYLNQEEQARVEEARRKFNEGAKLAEVAQRIHEELRLYFPPANGRTAVTYQRNGVTFEKVFDIEHKTYRDAAKKFEAAVAKVNGMSDPGATEVRNRAGQNIGMIKGYLDEIRKHKLRQLAGLSKAEELRMWQTFVSAQRSNRLIQTLDGA